MASQTRWLTTLKDKKCLPFRRARGKNQSKTEILAATRQSSLILIGRPFRSRNKDSSALFFRSFRWQIPWRRREMPPALSVPSLSEWSTSLFSFLISLVRVLSRVTWTVRSGICLSCLPPHKGVAFRGTQNLHCYCQAWTYLTLTQLRPWPHLDKTVMMWSTLAGYVALRWGKDHASRLSVWCVVGAS